MMNRRTRGFLQAAIGTFAVTPDAVLLRLAEMHGNAPLWAAAVKLMFIGFFARCIRFQAASKRSLPVRVPGRRTYSWRHWDRV